MNHYSPILRVLLLLLFSFILSSSKTYAQDTERPKEGQITATEGSIQLTLPDSVAKIKPVSLSLEHWRPNPKKAMWLALVIPGGGQIYNRKYWKLPIVYGGFVGCAYALSWNNMMYKDYSQAYLDIMDDDENTNSYMDFLPYGATVSSSNMARFQEILKKKKDYYRRYRDMSMFCFIGVYLLSVVDAYVDAELSSFDINDELSLRIEPAIINNPRESKVSFMKGNSYGLQCSLKF